MEKRNLLKAGLILAFILLAGVFYSCRGIKEPDTSITLQDGTANQETDDAVRDQGSGPLQTKQDGAGVTEETNMPGDSDKGNELKKDTAVQSTDMDSADSPQYIYVHLCGAVKNPDVYKVLKDTRLVEVLKLAGGLTKAAAGDYVNQAAVVVDGEQVYIPTKDEVEGILPDSFTEDKSSSLSTAGDNADSAGNTQNPGKININKASAEELMTLTGIGEAKAESILAYREEHGGFKTVEEIMNINGIKDSVFNKISDKITVN